MKQLNLLLRLSVLILTFLFISPIASRAIASYTFGFDNTPIKPGIELSYSYLEQVNAGDDFTFTIQLKKDSKYFIPGMISCKFFGGLTPKSTTIEGVNVSIQNNTVYLVWGKLSNSDIISFSLPVSTSKSMQGVYPVQIDYLDDFGFIVSNNVGVYVHNKSESPLPMAVDANEKSPYSISLNYPEAILFDGSYHIDIIVAKGKNTGMANVFVQIPPKSKLLDIDFDDFVYNAENGNLTIKIESMPPGPVFEIHCKIKNTAKVQAVYPLRASIKFENNTIVQCSDFIQVTNQHGLNQQAPVKARKNIAVETLNDDLEKVADMFSELDNLLDVWTKSSNNETQNQADSIFKIEPVQPAPAEEKIVFYSVQIIASAVEMPGAETELEALGITEKLLEDYDGSIYRYTVGVFNTTEEAGILKLKLAGLGYPDAFVVEYEDGNRVRSFY